MSAENMSQKYRQEQYCRYQHAREYCIHHPEQLIALETYVVTKIRALIRCNYNSIAEDFNEASYLSPFWEKFMPFQRGRASIGDQIPWIEVGEQAVGDKIKRLASFYFDRIDDIGLPSGADHRFTVSDKEIRKLVHFTDTAMIFLDTKTIGPRDNKPEIVASPYQISGDGNWSNPNDCVNNSVIPVVGKRTKHVFYPAISPIYVTSHGTAMPVIHIFVKPLYAMNCLAGGKGQPLEQISLMTVPNGLLLTKKPGYIHKQEYSGLFYPGKDTHESNLLRTRARINANLLKAIAPWRFVVLS